MDANQLLRHWIDTGDCVYSGCAMNRDDIQGLAIEHGFRYWRASDAHGVIGTKEQAIELLQDLLGVEVEIEDAKKDKP